MTDTTPVTTQHPHYFQPHWITPTSDELKVDVCVYGGTSAGISAALTLARQNRSVILLNPAQRVGGMTTHGLGRTDAGKKDVIGGLARQFYDLISEHYKKPSWHFEPHLAQNILDQWIQDTKVSVRHGEFLKSVTMTGQQIQSVQMLSGLVVHASMFIDATYEGDLMAKANVPFAIGRESNDVYQETLNGSQVRHYHQFSHPVDPYNIKGDPASGLLPGIEPGEPPVQGQGDHRIQAYCFRVCMTDNPANRVPFPKPEGYDPASYELLIRWVNSEKDKYNESLRIDDEIPWIAKIDRLAELSKTDTNNHGPVSSDFIGQNFQWPEASYEQREEIYQAHVHYQQGLYYTMANDPRVPERYGDIYRQWGLAADEFLETSHWPEQLYVREARRMVSDYVLTEQDCMHQRQCEDPVGMGSYAMDSHNCRRFVQDGRVINDGDVQVPTKGPYSVSYRSIIPGKGQCGNLLVPVCLSASHIAFGSIRMEPVYLILGESAALAADLALTQQVKLQDLPYIDLEKALLDARQVLRQPAQTNPS